ncbi:MAG TPA: methanogenesis marker 16 metalloprotein, partial [Methanofollis liminatans]|nr:methanogenesis marker 16 metalloprotein [Methanofollis liminatans]
AFVTGKGIDSGLCVSCGACASSCTGGAVEADLGGITVDGVRVPITLRQSDRNRAEALCADLRERILDLKFPIP